MQDLYRPQSFAEAGGMIGKQVKVSERPGESSGLNKGDRERERDGYRGHFKTDVY